MYQEAEEKINYILLASGIANWSMTRYGYFLKKGLDEVEVTKEFASELNHLPSHCLSFIDQAQHKWVDEGHDRAPNMIEFLKMLRGFNNQEVNMVERPLIEHGQIDYAGRWDHSSREDRFTFFERYDISTCPSSTKYWAKKFYQDNGWSDNKISKALCQK